MSVDLSDLPINEAQFQQQEFGGFLTPPLGGPVQRLDRAGNRSAIQFQTPLMPYEPDGRLWSARLQRAKREGGVIPIPQPDVDVGLPGLPVVATTTASGSSVPIEGMTPHYVIKEGQWISIVHGGRRYADQVIAQAIANATGEVTVTIQNLLRTSITAGDVVEIREPMIEGWIIGDFGWPIDLQRTSAFSFVVAEAA